MAAVENCDFILVSPSNGFDAPRSGASLVQQKRNRIIQPWNIRSRDTDTRRIENACIYFYCVTKSKSVGTVRPRNTGSVGGFW
ncbi:hypothetical protein, partial [Xanthomonas oryzae]